MKVAIFFGSKSDTEVMKKAADVLKEFGVEYKAFILSAHRAEGACIGVSAVGTKLLFQPSVGELDGIALPSSELADETLDIHSIEIRFEN